MADTIALGAENETLAKLVQDSGASVEIWEDENDKSQRLAAKNGDLGIELRLMNSKAKSWIKTLPEFLNKVKSGATFEQLLAYADENKLQAAGEKAKKYAVARKDIKETSFHKKYRENTTLETIYIASTVTKIEDDAFAGCKALQTAFIENGVTEIPYESFYGCKKLSSIVIPPSVRKMDGRAFGACPSLTEVEFKGTITEWEAVEDKELCMLQCIPAKSIKCTDGVWEKPLLWIVGGEAKKCLYEDATDIVIPGGVTKIGSRAFSFLESLVSVTLPESLTEIGDSAFSHCSSLKSIVIPDSVEKLDGCFTDCIRLESITIGSGVKEIHWMTFCGCKSLTQVTFNGKKAQWEAVQKKDSTFKQTPAKAVKCSDGEVPL